MYPTAAETTAQLEAQVKSLTETLADRMKAIDAIENPPPKEEPKVEEPKPTKAPPKPLILFSDTDSGEDADSDLEVHFYDSLLSRYDSC